MGTVKGFSMWSISKIKEHAEIKEAEDKILTERREEERKHWLESGQPKNHIFESLSVVLSNTPEFLEKLRNSPKDVQNIFFKQYQCAWIAVLDMYLEDERKDWLELDKPKNHFYNLLHGMEMMREVTWL